MAMDLNELTFDNIGVWPLPAKLALVSIICAVLLGFGYWLALKPQFQRLSTAQKDEIDLRSTFEVKSREAANLVVYQQQVKQIKERLANMLFQLPRSSEIPSLVEDISKVGVANGLQFKLIKPQPEIQKEFYAELPIQIEVEGNYHQLAEFISSMANLQRIVTIDDFSISPMDTKKTGSQAQDQSSGAPKKEELTMKMTAKTYRYLPLETEQTTPNNATKAQ